MERITSIEVNHVSREINKVTNYLSKFGKPDATVFKEIMLPSYDQTILMIINEPASWTTPIIDYLSKKSLLTGRNHSCSVHVMSSRYFLASNKLYRKSFSNLRL